MRLCSLELMKNLYTFHEQTTRLYTIQPLRNAEPSLHPATNYSSFRILH